MCVCVSVCVCVCVCLRRDQRRAGRALYNRPLGFATSSLEHQVSNPKEGSFLVICLLRDLVTEFSSSGSEVFGTSYKVERVD